MRRDRSTNAERPQPSSSSHAGIELLRERGVDELSLNFATFARILHNPRNALERVLRRPRALANPFFQIESLYRFQREVLPTTLGAALPPLRGAARAGPAPVSRRSGPEGQIPKLGRPAWLGLR